MPKYDILPLWMNEKQYLCHVPNLIPRFVTMTGMLISNLNLIITRTYKTFTKASIFLLILVSLLLDITFHLIF